MSKDGTIVGVTPTDKPDNVPPMMCTCGYEGQTYEQIRQHMKDEHDDSPNITESPETYSTDSLQAELRQILKDSFENQPTDDFDFGYAEKAILATVSKHLPEKHDSHGHPMSTIASARSHGRNKAITEMENKLGGNV